MGVIGLGVLAQQTAIALWKTVIPGGGILITIPLVYGLSYAIMQVIDAYYIAKAKKEKLSKVQIQQIFQNAMKDGKKKAKMTTKKKATKRRLKKKVAKKKTKKKTKKKAA